MRTLVTAIVYTLSTRKIVVDPSRLSTQSMYGTLCKRFVVGSRTSPQSECVPPSSITSSNHLSSVSYRTFAFPKVEGQESRTVRIAAYLRELLQAFFAGELDGGNSMAEKDLQGKAGRATYLRLHFFKCSQRAMDVNGCSFCLWWTNRDSLRCRKRGANAHARSNRKTVWLRFQNGSRPQPCCDFKPWLGCGGHLFVHHAMEFNSGLTWPDLRPNPGS